VIRLVVIIAVISSIWLLSGCEHREAGTPVTKPAAPPPAATQSDESTEADRRSFAAMLAEAERARHEPPTTQPGETLLRFRARVLSVGTEPKRGREGVVVDVDAHFALELYIESADPTDEIFHSGRELLLWIHSPSMLFDGRPETGIHDFWIVREDNPRHPADRYKLLALDAKSTAAPAPAPPKPEPAD
jgi:hypothetical protein